MNVSRRVGGVEEAYIYEPPRTFEPGQVARRSFEECSEERLRRPGESFKDWLEAIHIAMLEVSAKPRKRLRHREAENRNFVPPEEGSPQRTEDEDGAE